MNEILQSEFFIQADEPPVTVTDKRKEFPVNDLAKLRRVYYATANITILQESDCGCFHYHCHHRERFETIVVELPTYFSFDFMDENGIYTDSEFKKEILKKYLCRFVNCVKIVRKPHTKTDMVALLCSVEK